MRSEELRDLFSLRQHTLSDTYDSMCGDEDEPGDGGSVCAEVHKAQVGHDHESQANHVQSTVHVIMPTWRMSSCLWDAGCLPQPMKGTL